MDPLVSNELMFDGLVALIFAGAVLGLCYVVEVLAGRRREVLPPPDRAAHRPTYDLHVDEDK
jgi:hypothetical protein